LSAYDYNQRSSMLLLLPGVDIARDETKPYQGIINLLFTKVYGQNQGHFGVFFKPKQCFT